jgi:cysteine synthase
MYSHDLIHPVRHRPSPPAQAQLGTDSTHKASTVGGTPVVWMDKPFTTDGRGFWAKLEGHNPGGMKDRPALHMVARVRDRGELQPGGLIVESTSGTLGLGLALAGIVYDHPVTLVADSGMEPIVHRLLLAYGTRVDIVDQPHPTGGWQEARRARVAQLLADNPGSFCPDQYHNPDNVEAYESLAAELMSQFGRVDVLVCSVGTGGHSAGISRTLRKFCPDLRLVGVDTTGSTIFGQQARPRLMRGLGSSIYPRNVDYQAFDEIHWVGAAESVATCRRLAASQYASGGWSVGAVALVAGWLARTHHPDTRIAAIFPDGPQRYFDTVYNDEYCQRHGLLAAAPPVEPDTMEHPGDREVDRWTRCTTVVDPLTDRDVTALASGAS